MIICYSTIFLKSVLFLKKLVPLRDITFLTLRSLWLSHTSPQLIRHFGLSVYGGRRLAFRQEITSGKLAFGGRLMTVIINSHINIMASNANIWNNTFCRLCLLNSIDVAFRVWWLLTTWQLKVTSRQLSGRIAVLLFIQIQDNILKWFHKLAPRFFRRRIVSCTITVL